MVGGRARARVGHVDRERAAEVVGDDPDLFECSSFCRDELRAAGVERGFPLVLKPVDGRGARGVLRLTKDTDLAWAFAHATSQSRRGGVMVEEYLAGPQISTEGLLVDGEGTTCGFIDRNYEHLDTFAPYIVENGGEQPSAPAT